MTVAVHIYSFGFHFSGIPDDPYGNGGGFVFDCRCLPNPGTLEQYKPLTGLDSSVQQFFKDYEEVQDYSERCTQMVGNSIELYQKKGFSNLTVAFGCTGGQHRSVYQALLLERNLKDFEGIVTDVTHTEYSRWPQNS